MALISQRANAPVLPIGFGGMRGALGNAFLEVQAIFEPSRRHVLEERVKQEPESKPWASPPGPGS